MPPLLTITFQHFSQADIVNPSNAENRHLSHPSFPIPDIRSYSDLGTATGRSDAGQSPAEPRPYTKRPAFRMSYPAHAIGIACALHVHIVQSNVMGKDFRDRQTDKQTESTFLGGSK